MHTPLVSIITATYNRSNILGYTIASVLCSTFANWEMIIVGDACTDDTAQVVASFADPRIRFVNLPTNWGEQSGPNNYGFHLARGAYIAYLNHDDLWFPDHLALALDHLNTHQADLVFTLGIAIGREKRHVLMGSAPQQRYEPHILIPASLWVLRRELIEMIGPWRSAKTIHNVPSQDFLFRAWKAGKRLLQVPTLTVIAIQSGWRRNSYANREFAEHTDYAQRLASDPHLREQLLTYAALAAEHELVSLTFSGHLRRVVRNVLFRSSLALGLSPIGVVNRLRYWRKGGMITQLRKQRGLK
jgi:glycosyltransferase involved in cell wall biosynthesis